MPRIFGTHVSAALKGFPTLVTLPEVVYPVSFQADARVYAKDPRTAVERIADPPQTASGALIGAEPLDVIVNGPQRVTELSVTKYSLHD